MVTFETNGVQFTMLLDMVEVAKSHSGINLAAAFAKILDDFGISDKVSYILQTVKPHTHQALIDPQHHM